MADMLSAVSAQTSKRAMHNTTTSKLENSRKYAEIGLMSR